MFGKYGILWLGMGSLRSWTLLGRTELVLLRKGSKYKISAVVESFSIWSIMEGNVWNLPAVNSFILPKVPFSVKRE